LATFEEPDQNVAKMMKIEKPHILPHLWPVFQYREVGLLGRRHHDTFKPLLACAEEHRDDTADGSQLTFETEFSCKEKVRRQHLQGFFACP